jgi:hypothetical protein
MQIPRITLFFGLFLLHSQGVWGADSVANKVFQKVKDQVYKVVVSRGNDSAKSSYGSGFPIQKDGLLMTNYHVISDAFTKDEQYDVFVLVDGKPLKAKILNFDVVHDLALLKIPKTFSQVIRFNKGGMINGDKVFSVGFPKDLPVTIVEGTYNGVVKNGRYQEIHMSSGINSGMSGGPTLDKRGNLVGVNVSTMLFSQNISFAVPALFVKRLLKEKSSEEHINYQKSREIIKKQVLETQAVLADDILEASQTTKTFQAWTVTNLPPYVRCWQSLHKQAPHFKFEVEELTCHLQNGTRISSSLTTGYFSTKFYLYNNKGLNKFQFYNKIAENLETPRDITGLFNGYKKKKSHTFADCQGQYLVNQSGIPLKVNFCLQAYKDYSEIYDAYIDIVTLTKQDQELVMSANFHGFNSKNISALLLQFVEGIRL